MADDLGQGNTGALGLPRRSRRPAIHILGAFVLVAAFLSLSWEASGQWQRVEVDVTEVVDGDSFYVATPMAGTTEIRVNGIDAPETGEPEHDAAKAALRELLSRGQVVVVHRGSTFAPSGGSRQRLRAYVEVEPPDADLIFVDREMVRRGLAYVYAPAGDDRAADFVQERTDHIRAAMEEAQDRARSSGDPLLCARVGSGWEHHERCREAVSVWFHQAGTAYWVARSGILHWERCGCRRGNRTDFVHDKMEAFARAVRRCQRRPKPE